MEIGALNGIFVLGRSMGFIGELGVLTPDPSQAKTCGVTLDLRMTLLMLLSLLSLPGHYLDQKRLKQGLYRHPWDDISYVLPEHMSM